MTQSRASRTPFAGLSVRTRRLHPGNRAAASVASGRGPQEPAVDDELFGVLTVTVDSAPARSTLQSWDEFVRSCPNADVAQLSGWARVRARVGYRPAYVFLRDGARLVAGAQVLVRRIPLLGKFGYVPYGPLIAPKAIRSTAVHETLATAMAQVARQHRGLFVQPPEQGEQLSAALLRRGFRPSDAKVAPSTSLRIDLSLDEAQLRHNLSRRLRGWTRQWAARGVTVRRGGPEDLPLAARLHALTARHQGFSPLTLDYLAAMDRELSPSGSFFVLIGEVDGQPGAMGAYTGNGTVLKARLVGLDRTTRAARLEVVAALDWHALIWAKRNGYRWFDFSGVGAQSAAALESGCEADLALVPGADRYKLRFGGEPFHYPQPVERIPSPALQITIALLRRSDGGQRVMEFARRWARTGSWSAGSSPPGKGP